MGLLSDIVFASNLLEIVSLVAFGFILYLVIFRNNEFDLENFTDKTLNLFFIGGVLFYFFIIYVYL